MTLMNTPELVALCVTVLIETLIVAAVFSGQRGRMALACIAVSIAAYLLIHMVLPANMKTFGWWAVDGFVSATIIEAAVYTAVSESNLITRSILASVLANSMSHGAVFLWNWL